METGGSGGGLGLCACASGVGPGVRDEIGRGGDGGRGRTPVWCAVLLAKASCRLAAAAAAVWARRLGGGRQTGR